jgi:hypothetical protein
LVSS